jgi:hypothetical protein
MRWRVRAKSTDGTIVTVGRYATEEEARTDCEKVIREGFYRDVMVDPIPQAVDPARPPAEA